MDSELYSVVEGEDLAQAYENGDIEAPSVEELEWADEDVEWDEDGD